MYVRLERKDVTNLAYFVVEETKGQLYVDLIGRFITLSTARNQYIRVFYIYDKNYVHVELMKDRTGVEQIATYKRAYDFMQKRVLKLNCNDLMMMSPRSH